MWGSTIPTQRLQVSNLHSTRASIVGCAFPHATNLSALWRGAQRHILSNMGRRPQSSNIYCTGFKHISKIRRGFHHSPERVNLSHIIGFGASGDRRSPCNACRCRICVPHILPSLTICPVSPCPAMTYMNSCCAIK